MVSGPSASNIVRSVKTCYTLVACFVHCIVHIIGPRSILFHPVICIQWSLSPFHYHQSQCQLGQRGYWHQVHVLRWLLSMMQTCLCTHPTLSELLLTVEVNTKANRCQVWAREREMINGTQCSKFREQTQLTNRLNFRPLSRLLTELSEGIQTAECRLRFLVDSLSFFLL